MIRRGAGRIGLVMVILGLMAATNSVGADGTSRSAAMPVGGSCTNILVGREASADGSTIASYSGDSFIHYSFVGFVPHREFQPGTTVPIYRGSFSGTYSEYLDSLAQVEKIGEIPQVEETYAYIDLMCGYDGGHAGGMNEHGVTIGETTIVGRPELVCPEGMLMAASSCAEGGLMTLALQRATTAREAIEIMGELAEEYGYHQPMWHGEHLSVSDGKEVWAFEIFGPGDDWTPGCGKPGAVWCAQRIPDYHVGVSANRSRIGEIEPTDPNWFLCSDNVYSLAEEMGWWTPGDPFVWYEAYAPDNCMTYCSLREWRVLSALAPSLNLDPNAERFPFSVQPDGPVSVQDVMRLHRDYYQGTPYDITDDSAFQVNGQPSPLTYPYYSYGQDALQELLNISPQRTLAVRSLFSYVAQVHEGAPAPIKGCFWYGQGPASTTCYVPIYSGVTALPELWGKTLMTRIDWETAFWAFDLVHELARIRWQDAYLDINAVRNAAEAELFLAQPGFEQHVSSVLSTQDEAAARALVTDYTATCMDAVLDGYWALVDYLLFTYYFLASETIPQPLPEILVPDAPDPYADTVISFALGVNANPLAKAPLDALGCPDFSYSPLGGFLNLGTGGSITLRFDDNIITNGSGDDIKIWGDPTNDDQIIVEVSQTGQQFHSFGVTNETASLDLSAVGLNFARFIRITADATPPVPNEDYPGAEVDAVEALH